MKDYTIALFDYFGCPHRQNGAALTVNLSPELENVVGKGPMTRAQVTSKVWEYIKGHGLQDSKDKRVCPCPPLAATIMTTYRCAYAYSI